MLKLVVICVACALLAGCANPWAANFQMNPIVPEKAPPTQQVEIRTVEFERLANYENAEHQWRVQSSTAPADYTAEQRLEAKNRLLEALQLKERDDQIEILGWSRFADTERLGPADKRLEKFAREIGADVVVVSSGYGGQVNRIVDYPLTSYSNYYTTVAGPRGRRSTLYSTGGYQTVWVPTSVTENQYLYQAVFLRRRLGSTTSQSAGVSTTGSLR